MNTDKNYMLRAIELARNGLGSVSPNPMVGCVIICNDKIIGEGYHQKYGGPHAEVNAINSVQNSDLLAEATAYVNLEPCSHYGKTPPCADLLVKHKIKRVVIANTDPNPLVAGRGVDKLKKQGITVEIGVCRKEGEKLNKRFFTFIEKKRPYIILKWAQTKDGFVARSNYDSKWISNPSSRKLVHKWRSEESAILVGFKTAYHDNPKLNVRDWKGNDPTRVYIDYDNSIPNDDFLKDGKQPTICYSITDVNDTGKVEFVKLNKENFLIEMMDDLYERKLQSIIIEGGSATLKRFIENDLWDEAKVFIGDVTFGEGVKAPQLNKKTVKTEIIEGDELLTYFNK